jgi:membrane-bound metal-dependent hydrolase YbcI (DUF457 family)
LDPVSHAAFGRLLSALGARKRLGAGATTACVLGALCPDLDIVRALQGWDVYLLHHQSGTHCVVGAVGCGILTGSAVRPWVRRGRWILLVAAGTIGSVSHLLLDLVSGADLRLFAPFAHRIFALPLFAMADPWLLGALVIAAFTVSCARPRAAVAGLVLICLMLSVKAVLSARANAIERRDAGGAATHVEAVFGSWTRWTQIRVRETTVERWDVDVRHDRATLAGAVRRNLALPLVARSRALPTVVNFLASHDDTFALVSPTQDGGHRVRWSALRYCAAPQPGSEPVCGLWFGGEYDAAGRPIAATVWIGSIVQRRAPFRAAADDQ